MPVHNFRERVSGFPHENLIDIPVLKGHHQFGGKHGLVCKCWYKCQALTEKEKCACSNISKNTRVFWSPRR